MSQVSTVLAAGVNVVDNRTLNTNAPMRFWFDKATVSGHFDVYGILDSTTTLVTQNAQPLGGFDVSPGQVEIPPEIQNALQAWPLLLVVSPGVATFIVEGNAAPATATNQSVTAPVGTAFSALMTVSSYNSAGVRIMGSKAMTPGDQFNIYGTNDLTTNPTVTGTNGAQFLGNLFGSSGATPTSGTSLVIKGWAAVFFQRDPSSSGATAGTIQGCGVLSGTGGGAGTAWVIGGNTPSGTGIFGTLDNVPVTFETNSLVRMTLLGGAATSGFLGIGIASPTAQLHVRSTASTAAVVALQVEGNTTSTETDITFLSRHVTSNNITLTMGGATVNWSLTTDPGKSGANTFQIGDATSGNARLFINGSGFISVAGAPATTAAVGCALDVQSVLAGLGLPIMTTTQRNTWAALPPAKAGTVIFNTTTGTYEYWTGAVVRPLGTFVNVTATNANAQSVVNNNAATGVVTWVEVTDSVNAFNNATGVFTVPAGAGGFYNVTLTLQFAATAVSVGAEYQAIINKNSGTLFVGSLVAAVAVITQKRQVSVTIGLQLAAGDTIAAQVSLTGAGGNVALTADATTNLLTIAQTS